MRCQWLWAGSSCSWLGSSRPATWRPTWFRRLRLRSSRTSRWFSCMKNVLLGQSLALLFVKQPAVLDWLRSRHEGVWHLRLGNERRLHLRCHVAHVFLFLLYAYYILNIMVCRNLFILLKMQLNQLKSH
jgi:hypothetical protein